MPELMSPTAALNQAFVLPKVDAAAQRPGAVQVQQQNVLATYGLLVSNMGLLLPVGVASRLVETDIDLCRLPTAPAWLLGMMNLDGNTVPLFDLDALLDFPGQHAPSHYLVIGEGEDAAGITLAERPQRVRLGPDQQMNRNHPLPAALQAHVRACYRDGDQVWVDWDYIGFFQAVGRRI